MAPNPRAHHLRLVTVDGTQIAPVREPHQGSHQGAGSQPRHLHPGFHAAPAAGSV